MCTRARWLAGCRWAQIAKHLPGRTDNEVKNFWNSCIKKKLIAQGLDPRTHNLLPASTTLLHGGGGANHGSDLASFQSNGGNCAAAAPAATTSFTISSSPAKAGFEVAPPAMAPTSLYDAIVVPNPVTGMLMANDHQHLAAASAPLLGYPYTDASISDGVLLSLRDQNAGVHASSMDFMNASSSSSSMDQHVAGGMINYNDFSTSAAVFMDETTTMWATAIEPGMGVAEMEVAQQQQQVLGQQEMVLARPPTTLMNDGATATATATTGAALADKSVDTVDVSSAAYGAAGPSTALFDLELLDSCGMFCGGAGNAIDQLRWDC
ncbi:hypothetical protein GUJ93_ZPchr0013g37926 [Zizania palustris]|uniref:Uncharacterized protein n=1 Tax=Zizania palustris TaxID=103762 RepID=A0A8J5X8M4_ZIZPA|nr:hypothetical protein GUJ93_ZPchr0013g37926 [Zizania palustris]